MSGSLTQHKLSPLREDTKAYVQNYTIHTQYYLALTATNTSRDRLICG